HAMREIAPLLASALLVATCRPRSVEKMEAAVTVFTKNLSLSEVRGLVWKPGRDATYREATAEEREAIAHLVGEMTSLAVRQPPGDPATLVPLARTAGFTVERWQLGGTTYLAALEAPDQRRGAGAYLVRVGATPEDTAPAVLLQAPHAYFDMDTDE